MALPMHQRVIRATGQRVIRQSKESQLSTSFQNPQRIICRESDSSVKSLRTIDESVKGAASLRRYGITFDGNIHI